MFCYGWWKIKNGVFILTEKYFDELLERIREIRLSENMMLEMLKLVEINDKNIKNEKWK